MTTLPELLSEHGEAITRAVLRAYPPVYTARNREDWGFDLSRLKRRPMGAQADAIRATAASLRSHRGTNVVGEMGTGKTMIGASAAGEVLASAPPLPDDRLYPKEQALVDLALAERAERRRVLVYITHTESRDLTPRLTRVLTDAGLRVSVLKADTVAPDRREEWVARRVREGVDVLLVHPRLVQTGLDYEESGENASRTSSQLLGSEAGPAPSPAFALRHPVRRSFLASY